MQWTAEDVELATVQLFNAIAASPALHKGADSRSGLLLLLQLWSKAHPVERCRRGSHTIITRLKSVWPDGKSEPLEDISAMHVCGTSSPVQKKGQEQWVACKGTKTDTRGFTCGLWLLFHATAARVPETDGGALFMPALRGFVHHFFQCEDCRSHFIGIVDSEAAQKASNRRAVVMWLWSAHNEVGTGERL